MDRLAKEYDERELQGLGFYGAEHKSARFRKRPLHRF
jgi:hypothetical protein